MPTIARFLAIFSLAWGLAAAVTPAAAQNPAAKWASWAALQAVPSPGFVSDHGASGNSLTGELRWQVVPVSWSFGASTLVSPAQFFIVNPVHRHSGSVEAFAEPAWALGPLRESGDDRFALGTGARLYLPVEEYGEELSLSFAAKLLLRDGPAGGRKEEAGFEAGVYTLFGVLGLRFEVTTDPAHRAAFSLALRYF